MKQEAINYSEDKPTKSSSRRSAIDDIISDGLIQIREKSGLRQKELAELVNVKPQMISRYEKKESIVPFDLAYEIAAKLGFKLEDFFAVPQKELSQYALSDNEQKILKDYPVNSQTTEKDMEQLKTLYLSINDTEKRAQFMAVLENVVKTYQD